MENKNKLKKINLLKKFRKRLDLTQLDLALDGDLSLSTIQKLECGTQKDMTIKNFDKLCNVLKLINAEKEDLKRWIID